MVPLVVSQSVCRAGSRCNAGCDVPSVAGLLWDLWRRECQTRAGESTKRIGRVLPTSSVCHIRKSAAQLHNLPCMWLVAQVEQLFRSHYVGLSEGSYFGTSRVSLGSSGSESSTEVIDHMRLNFGCPSWRLEEGLRRIEAAVASVPRPSGLVSGSG